jgi:hypothetical protein
MQPPEFDRNASPGGRRLSPGSMPVAAWWCPRLRRGGHHHRGTAPARGRDPGTCAPSNWQSANQRAQPQEPARQPGRCKQTSATNHESSSRPAKQSDQPTQPTAKAASGRQKQSNQPTQPTAKTTAGRQTKTTSPAKESAPHLPRPLSPAAFAVGGPCQGSDSRNAEKFNTALTRDTDRENNEKKGAGRKHKTKPAPNQKREEAIPKKQR